MEGRGFRDQFNEFEALDVTVLGVSFDSIEENAAFASKFEFPYDLLCDTDRSLGLAYGACDNSHSQHARRITYLIDKSGTVINSYENVTPRTHAGEILADLIG